MTDLLSAILFHFRPPATPPSRHSALPPLRSPAPLLAYVTPPALLPLCPFTLLCPHHPSILLVHIIRLLHLPVRPRQTAYVTLFSLLPLHHPPSRHFAHLPYSARITRPYYSFIPSACSIYSPCSPSLVNVYPPMSGLVARPGIHPPPASLQDWPTMAEYSPFQVDAWRGLIGRFAGIYRTLVEGKAAKVEF
jgi:hypothetical protein